MECVLSDLFPVSIEIVTFFWLKQERPGQDEPKVQTPAMSPTRVAGTQVPEQSSQVHQQGVQGARTCYPKHY